MLCQKIDVVEADVALVVTAAFGFLLSLFYSVAVVMVVVEVVANL